MNKIIVSTTQSLKKAVKTQMKAALTTTLQNQLALALSLSTQPCNNNLKISRTPSTSIKMSSTIPELEPIFHDKKIVRSKLRKSLKDMSPSLRSHQDDVIQRLVLDAPWFKSSRRLCAYISCQPLREVDTSKILAEILQSPENDSDKVGRKTLYVPRVEDKNCHMRMLHITRIDDLIANSMNILEPASIDSHGNQREDVMHASEPVDLMLLPGLGFDKSGRRLGRGGGYYDTFLSNYQRLANEKNWKQPLLVALSYSTQILEDGVIPVTPHDVDIDALVSPAGIIPITKTARHRMEHGL